MVLKNEKKTVKVLTRNIFKTAENSKFGSEIKQNDRCQFENLFSINDGRHACKKICIQTNQ